MVLKIFTQPSCPKCPPAKKLGKELERARKDLKVEYWDVATVDGLADASFYTVMSTPGLILCDDERKEIKGWRGETPSKKEILAQLKVKR